MQLLASTSGPVVVGNPFLFMQMTYYVGDPLKGRLVYLADPDLANRFTGSDTEDRNLLLLKRAGDLPVEPYRAFIAAHPSFTMVCTNGYWVPKKLARDSVDVRVDGLFEGDLRYEVTIGR